MTSVDYRPNAPRLRQDVANLLTSPAGVVVLRLDPCGMLDLLIEHLISLEPETRGRDFVSRALNYLEAEPLRKAVLTPARAEAIVRDLVNIANAGGE